MLLPFSVLGILFFGLGLPGLSPFVSAAVVGWRARTAYLAAPVWRRLAHAIVGFALFVGVCTVTQWQVSAMLERSVQEIRSGRPDLAENGVARLRRWRPLLDLDQLVLVWTSEPDAARKQRLAVAYRRVTGLDVQDRSDALRD